jgi:MFS family permease
MPAATDSRAVPRLSHGRVRCMVPRQPNAEGPVSFSLERIAVAFALGYVALFVSLIAFTTNGPDPTLKPADEMARAVSEGDAMRASALLGFAAALAFAGFAVCLAFMVVRRGHRLASALIVAAGAVVVATDAISSAALIVAVEAADRNLGAGVFAAFGDLHTAALLLEIAPIGVVLLLAWRAGLGRIVSWAGIVVGVGCLLAPGAEMSRDFDQGPFGFAVVVWFIGLPLWLIATSIVLLRRGTQPHADRVLEQLDRPA